MKKQRFNRRNSSSKKNSRRTALSRAAALTKFEPLEGRTLMSAGNVTGFALVDASSQEVVTEVTSGAWINLAELQNRDVHLVAETEGDVDSVSFVYDGNEPQIDYTPEFVMTDPATMTQEWTAAVGFHTVVASAESDGVTTNDADVHFMVIDEAQTEPGTTSGTLTSPSQTSVNAAIAQPLIRFNRTIVGGAYTDGAWNGGASITLAVAAYAGNTSADTRLLQQIRYSITGGNEICANGGYPAQHELHATGMFAIARQTPRIWSQLSTAEKTKIDLLMKAALVSSAFTTSDNNPFVKSGGTQYSLDGDSNLHREWNPNYRVGMLGGLFVGVAYFGQANAEAILNSYDHAAFVSQLSANGLSNAYQTFNWKAAHPTSNAPTGATIASAIKNYRYYGLSLSNYMGMYSKMSQYNYGGYVSSGLNNGAGLNGAGKIASGAENLPNQGALGMLTEFNSADGNGPRSSALYAYDGFRPQQTITLAMIASGAWDADSPEASDTFARMRIGATDLFYKLDQGYLDYYKGAARGQFDSTFTDRGFQFTRPMWDVLEAYADGATTPGGPVAAPTSVSATVVSPSRVDLVWTDNSDNEGGFQIERSTDGVNFTHLATVGADVTTYSCKELTANTTYTFRVRAVAGDQTSQYAKVTATTPKLPLQPSSVKAKVVSSTRVDLTWSDNTSDEVNFLLDRSTDGVKYVRIARLAANAESYSDRTVTAGQTYYYRLAAVTANSASKWSAPVAVTPGGVTPPTLNAVVARATSQLKVMWSDNSNNESSFVIERSSDGVNFEEAGTVGVNTTLFLDENLSRGTRYYYRVKAVDDGVSSAWSGVVSGTTLTDPAAPAITSVVVVSDTQLKVNWSDNSVEEQYYILERSTDGVNYTRVVKTAANATTFTDDGLTPGTKYYYRVRASTSTLSSKWSNTASATTSGAATQTPFSGSPIAVPGTIEAENFDTGGEGVAYHNLTATNDGGAYRTDEGVDIGGNDAVGYVLGWTRAGEWLEYTIDVAETRSYRFEARIASTAGGSALHVEIDGSDETGTIAVPNTGGWDKWSTVAKGGINLTAGVHVMRVHIEAGGMNLDNFKLVAETAPTAPTGLSASASGNRINLNWSHGSVDESGFRIEQSDDGVNFTQVGSAAAGATGYSATGLSLSTKYYFRVRAYNSIGNSGYSNVASATTDSSVGTGDTLGGYVKPSASNAGLTNPNILTTRTTPLVTSYDGQVIENIDFVNAYVEFRHDNVIVRNCRFTGGPAYFSNVATTGSRVENCYAEWNGGNISAGTGISLIDSHFKNIGSGDFWRNPGNCTWEGNYFEDLGPVAPEAHRDIAQWFMPTQRESNMTIRGNFFDIIVGNAHNAAIFNPDQVTGLVIEYNWFKGSTYQIRTSNSIIRGNQFESWAFAPVLMHAQQNILFEDNTVKVLGLVLPLDLIAHVAHV